MIKKDIFVSSGKIVGEVILDNNVIKINNFKKPPIIEITDKKIIDIFDSKVVNIPIALELYNDYNLLIGEIAAIFGVFYSHLFQKIRYIDKAGTHEGRRNSSYNREFSKSQREAIGRGNKKHYEHFGPRKNEYKRTPEIRDKIRKGVYKAIEEGRLDESANARKGWENGKFDSVNFKKGIGGFITSKKIGERFFFRSLLELYYIINYLELDDNVISYKYEPFRINCDDGSIYTPDFIINNKYVKELKSYKFIYKQGGEIQRKFEYKRDQAIKYCNEHNLEYEVVFDKDINFKYDVLKHELKDKKYIEDFQIEFLQPERVWSRK